MTSRQREPHDKRCKDLKQHDVFGSKEHREPAANDEGGEGAITEGFVCHSQGFGLCVAMGAIKRL